MLRLLLAWLHLVALGLGLGAVIARGTALREPASAGSLRRAFRADTMWGIAALLWIGTGLWRLLAGTDKATLYYMQNHAFFAKMGMLLVILVLEVWPAMTLIRWRRALGAGEAPEAVYDAGAARRIAIISHVEALLVTLMVFAAVAMARGLGVVGG
jgi:putative membrane protein